MLESLCTLITALTCVSAVTVLTQKPTVVSLSRGESVTMDCNLGTGTNVGAWYKQVPGEVPQFVLVWYRGWSSVTYGSGFSSPRFTSTHQSTSDYRLMINNLEEGDSAVYYCGTWDDSASEAELQSNKATLVCLSRLSAPFAEVSWLLGDTSVSSGISTSTPVQQADQTFQISSHLSILTSDWDAQKVYTCKVSVGSQTAEKSLKKSECEE
ncbi:hypothetical protein fugu_015346 [Takifugu bimaculatus]|uniref:Ig-like domain-containing protein n=1 Tax=Takifugu bimaculatus TaxID=433685 RepID=A0A4Z2C0G5_9TELE|nr:hypothetical protein fugu_015346 [Takifugu bimaculatus]